MKCDNFSVTYFTIFLESKVLATPLLQSTFHCSWSWLMLSDEQQSNINKNENWQKRNINLVSLIRKQISHHLDLIWVKWCIMVHAIIAKSLIFSHQNNNINFFAFFIKGEKLFLFRELERHDQYVQVIWIIQGIRLCHYWPW